MTKTKKKNAFIFRYLFFSILLIASFLLLACYLTVSKAEKNFGKADRQLHVVSRLKYAYILNKNNAILTPLVAFPDDIDKKFFINSDETVLEICAKLENEKIVPNGDLACQLLIYYGRDRMIQPGSYTIPSGLNTIEIVQRVGNVAYRDKDLYIFAGWRLEEIANAIDTLGLSFTGDEFLSSALNIPNEIREKYEFLPGDSLEGFILSGQYHLQPIITLIEALGLFMDTFESKVVLSGLKTELETQKLSLIESLTMASIIQRETLAVEEMPTMASVFYNRLRLGMRLETDVTVQYAIGWDDNTKTWWKPGLTWTDLAINSSYNTYQVNGLPPGPICSPSLEVIQAVARPAQSDYLFFRAACDNSGRHIFAKTYEEHLKNGCE